MRKSAPGAPVEAKVKYATATAAVTPFVLWVLGTYLFHGAVPDPVAGLVAFAVPAIFTFVISWATRHTPRPASEHEPRPQ